MVKLITCMDRRRAQALFGLTRVDPETRRTSRRQKVLMRGEDDETMVPFASSSYRGERIA
ncbi:hypothetical protein DSCOOX_60960 [Desulfosarcina ovata subsp. ovata]|uniref:Uncharacterized protein n=1 Tax=Desulfosarcina ovata subsp. ovata TaxID=2752305 RepID=A0A5K8AK93_9BACT|nr:hypothetical protein DSCOOX_60960 [Desulfosarcina ovata subsp. ovata]